MTDKGLEKQKLRQRLLQQLAALSPGQRQSSDQLLFQRFLSLPQVDKAQTILAFWGVAEREPDTKQLVHALHERGKRVCLPRMLPRRGMETPLYNPAHPLIPVQMGLLEPDRNEPLIAKQEIDLVLVPSICYDRNGYRLGFGGGYYDRWLADFSGMLAGLCRSCVLQETLPVEAHDIPVQIVLTEDECLS